MSTQLMNNWIFRIARFPVPSKTDVDFECNLSMFWSIRGLVS